MGTETFTGITSTTGCRDTCINDLPSSYKADYFSYDETTQQCLCFDSTADPSCLEPIQYKSFQLDNKGNFFHNIVAVFVPKIKFGLRSDGITYKWAQMLAEDDFFVR